MLYQHELWCEQTQTTAQVFYFNQDSDVPLRENPRRAVAMATAKEEGEDGWQTVQDYSSP
ncbi:hypothetical protein PBNK5_35170 [Pectobacterium brasiliense]